MIACNARAIFAVTCLVLSQVDNAAAQSNVLRISNFYDYMDPAILAGFEAETGIEVIETFHDYADAAELTILAGGSGMDLVVIPLSNVARLHDADVIAAFDVPVSSRALDLDSDILEIFARSSDAANEFTVPYLWGTTGLYYDETQVRALVPDTPLDSWQLLFDPEVAEKLSSCGIGVIDSIEDVLPAVLSYLGDDLQQNSTENIESAFDLLRDVSQYVTSFEEDQWEPLLAGKFCVAISWSIFGAGAALESSRSSDRFVIPREGSTVWFDVFVMPKDAKNKGTAQVFMDFILRPENQAKLAAWNYGASIVAAAKKFLPSNFPGDTMISPNISEHKLSSVPNYTGEAKSRLEKEWRRIRLIAQ